MKHEKRLWTGLKQVLLLWHHNNTFELFIVKYERTWIEDKFSVIYRIYLQSKSVQIDYEQLKTAVPFVNRSAICCYINVNSHTYRAIIYLKSLVGKTRQRKGQTQTSGNNRCLGGGSIPCRQVTSTANPISNVKISVSKSGKRSNPESKSVRPIR
jgi:hypothetical protein